MTDERPELPAPPAPVGVPGQPHDPVYGIPGMQGFTEDPSVVPASVVRLADGEWHRLHPASPLLKGGIAFIAILGVIIVNLRDIFIDMLFGGRGGGPEPLVWVFEHGYVGLGILAIVVVLLLFIGGFYLSWRMHTFRITNEVVEVRSGILFRTNRKARLDRIQGINIVRPFFARLFGAAKLEVNQAGQDANVQLAYLGSAAAEELRREILRLASGAQGGSAAPAAAAAQGGIVGQRVSELLAPELDPSLAPPESVVKIHLGRLIGSLVLSGFTVFVILAVVGVIVTVTITKEYFFLFAIAPAIIGFGGFYISRFTRSLRYSIAGTPDGVRVGFGLLSTSNETLPPGRIHSVQVVQPLLWRAAGWWEIKVNRAAHSSAKGAAGQANTTILPVGSRDDVMRVLALLLPALTDDASRELLAQGLDSRGDNVSAAGAEGTVSDPLATPSDAVHSGAPVGPSLTDGGFAEAVPGAVVAAGGAGGFTNSPRRAAILRWFSWRRNGFAMLPGAILLRKGAIWRSLTIVPQARMQSVGLRQGPLLRRLGLGSVQLHTVAGPIVAEIGAIDRDDALRFFSDVADAAVASASADTTHRWRSGEAPA